MPYYVVLSPNSDCNLLKELISAVCLFLEYSLLVVNFSKNSHLIGECEQSFWVEQHWYL